MSSPPTSTPWVPIWPNVVPPSVIDPPVDGYWAKGQGGRVVWIPTPTVPGLATPDTGWHNIGAGGEIPFENGWGIWPDANYTPCRYRKTADGIVHFEGLIRPGTGGGPACFTMPVGYRMLPNAGGTPKTAHRFGAQSQQPIPWGSFWIEEDGRIRPETSIDGWISLTCLRYYAGL